MPTLAELLSRVTAKDKKQGSEIISQIKRLQDAHCSNIKSRYKILYSDKIPDDLDKNARVAFLNPETLVGRMCDCSFLGIENACGCRITGRTSKHKERPVLSYYIADNTVQALKGGHKAKREKYNSEKMQHVITIPGDIANGGWEKTRFIWDKTQFLLNDFTTRERRFDLRWPKNRNGKYYAEELYDRLAEKKLISA